MAAVKKAAAPATKKAPAKPTRPAAKKPATKPAAKKAVPVKKSATSKKPASSSTPPAADGELSTSHVALLLTHADLQPSPDNLRGTLTDISDLADSIASVGVLEPLLVSVEISDTSTVGQPAYRIVAGHRRHAAIGALIKDGRWPKTRRVPCVTGPTELDAVQRTVAMLIENLQRVDLDPIEEATGYQRLVDAGWKQTRIATAVGRHQNRVSERVRLLRLPAAWHEHIATGALTLQFAATLASTPPAVLEQLAAKKVLPTQWALDDATRTHRSNEARRKVVAACEERSLEYSKQESWKLRSTHDLVTECSPTALAKVLLPDAPDLLVTLDTGGGYTGAKPTASVWRPKPTNPDDAELTDYQRWLAACERISADHAAAVTAWTERQTALQIEFCQNADTKAIAQEAMHYVFATHVEYDLERLAPKYGWEKPAGASKAVVKEHVLAWAMSSKNFPALVAHALLAGHRETKVLAPILDAIVAEQLGDRPVREPNPPKPEIPAHSDEELAGADWGDDDPAAVERDETVDL